MNISSTSNATASIFASQSVQSTRQCNDGDSDNDAGAQGAAPAGPRGHGQMMEAVMQALQSLGLSPTSSDGTTSDSSSASTSSQGDATSATPSGGDSVRKDMHHFMHALFQALKGEGTSSGSSSSDASSSGTPQSSMATDLSSLISDVSNGQAPSGLQDAFSKLASDLQASGGSSTSTSAGTGSQATLQAFLTALQQDIGYGSTAASTSAGSLVTTQA